MDYKYLLVDINEQIATITLNRPKALNALSDALLGELGHLFNSGLDREKLKGIIITGAGEKAFMAGADISEFQGLDKDGGFEKSKAGQDVCNAIENFPLPVIAAINGFALGGGNELAMSCHIRICSENARFGQPEVNLGLIPGYGGTQRMIQYIGKGRAMELLLTGDMIDAEKALEYGLVTHVTKSEDLLDVAKKLILKISTKGPLAVSKIIESVNNYFDKTANGFVKERIHFSKTMGSEESTEGVNAFLEKRKPSFRN